MDNLVYTEEIINYIYSDQQLLAIKVVRESYGVSLPKAIEMIRAYKRGDTIYNPNGARTSVVKKEEPVPDELPMVDSGQSVPPSEPGAMAIAPQLVSTPVVETKPEPKQKEESAAPKPASTPKTIACPKRENIIQRHVADIGDKMFEEDEAAIVRSHAAWGALIMALPLFGVDWIIYCVVLWHMYSALCERAGTTLNVGSIIVGLIVNVVVMIGLDLALSFLPIIGWLGSGLLVYLQFYLSGKSYIETLKQMRG